MTTKRTSPPREECRKSLKTAASLDTQVTTLTAENTMDAEQEYDELEGMTVVTDGPFNSTDDMREICGWQEAKTTISNAPRNETEDEMEGTGPKQHASQHRDYKVRRGSSPPPTPEDELTPFLPTTSPKRNKKLKMGRDTSLPRERTRSKTRNITPRRL